MPEIIKEFILNSPLPGFMLDAEGVVSVWNRAAATLTGIAESAMLGSRDHWKPFYLSQKPQLCDILLTGIGWENFVAPVSPTRRGDEAWTLARIEKDMAGEVLLFIQAGIMRDKSRNILGAWQIFQTLSLHHVLGCTTALDMLISTVPYPLAFVVNGRHFRSNQAFAELWGLEKPEDAIGLNAGAFIAEEDRERFYSVNLNNHSNVETGKTYEWKYNVKGQIKYVQGTPKVFELGNDRILISALKDVTAEVRRQKDLEQEKRLLEAENKRLLATIGRNSQIFVGKSAAMRRTLERAAHLSRNDANLVILGETGSGKSLLARAIHDMSSRSGAPFIAVNCAAIPEQLFESEFFGHVRGAFTGALQQKTGYLGKAHGGTLFLDEVGELSPLVQSKLLHAVEWKKFSPLGSTKVLDSDVRLICATNRDLETMLRNGSMREDFFYRIFVADLVIPSLRDRRDDLPALFDFLMEKFGADMKWNRMSLKMRKKLQAYSWPGNVREFQNVLTRYIVTGELVFVGRHNEAKEEIGPLVANSAGSPPPSGDLNLSRCLDRAERECILNALRACAGRKDHTARALGINVRTLQRRCARLGI